MKERYSVSKIPLKINDNQFCREELWSWERESDQWSPFSFKRVNFSVWFTFTSMLDSVSQEFPVSFLFYISIQTTVFHTKTWTWWHNWFEPLALQSVNQITLIIHFKVERSLPLLLQEMKSKYYTNTLFSTLRVVTLVCICTFLTARMF